MFGVENGKKCTLLDKNILVYICIIVYAFERIDTKALMGT